MYEEEQDARWQEILEARADFAGPTEFSDQPLPLRQVGSDAAPRRGSRKSARFDEALSDLGSWSSIDAPRRRLSA